MAPSYEPPAGLPTLPRCGHRVTASTTLIQAIQREPSTLGEGLLLDLAHPVRAAVVFEIQKTTTVQSGSI